jgi:Ran GTPase-activating protein (RanGAP) involved in mRNA processing and transport
MQPRHYNHYSPERSPAVIIERLQSNDRKFKYLIIDLNIVFGTMDDGILMQIAEAIKVNTTLTTIRILGKNNFHIPLKCTAAGAGAIGCALKDHPQLKKIVLNVIGSDRIIGFLSALTGTAPITDLTINACYANDAFVSDLAKKLRQQHKLKKITIESISNTENLLDLKTIKELSAGLISGSLETLELIDLNLGNNGVAYLAKYLAKSTTLTQLTLKGISLSAAGVRRLSPALIANRYLTELYLENNPLELEGIQELMKVLPSLNSLQHLSLLNTQLDDHTIAYLADQWRILKLPVPSLSIASNEFTDAATKDIYKLIDGNLYLKILSVNKCNISDDQLSALAPLLSNSDRCHIERFSFKGNQLSNNSHKILSTILKNNKFIQFDWLPRVFLIHEQNKKNLKYITMRFEQECLDQAIEIANYHTSPSASAEQNKFLMLPTVVIQMIMSMLYASNITNSVLCSQLIYNNFSVRRALIIDGQYTPETKNPDITPWWNKSIKHNNKNKKLFKNNCYARLFNHAQKYEMPEDMQQPESSLPCCYMM